MTITSILKHPYSTLRAFEYFNNQVNSSKKILKRMTKLGPDALINQFYKGLPWVKSEEDFGEKIREIEKEINAFRQFRVEFRAGTPRDYYKWLEGFLEAGGSPTNYYERSYPRTAFMMWNYYEMVPELFVAVKDFEIPSLFGSDSVDVIVPKGINVRKTEENLGHNNLYFLEGFTEWGDFVLVYKDVFKYPAGKHIDRSKFEEEDGSRYHGENPQYS